MLKKQSEAFHTFLWQAFFPSLKPNFIAYRYSKMSSRPDCIFEIHQQWQSGFSRVYSNCCCSCSFEPEIIKIGQSSHKMYNNNIVNFQESTTILNACTKKSGNLLKAPRTWKYWTRTPSNRDERKSKKGVPHLETTLCNRNIIKETNTWAIPHVRYHRPFLKWTREELGQMGQRKRKPMTIYKALHPRDDVHRRKDGGRELDSIQDYVDATIWGHEEYIKKSKKKRLIAATRDRNRNVRSNRKTKTRKQKWEEKQLYRYFKRQAREVAHKKIWTWLKKENPKKETESILIAAQSNAIRINFIKGKIDNTQQISKCRLCGEVDETIIHIISEFYKLV